MKNFSLGLKIASGFALLIIMAMALGGVAIWNMGKVGTQSNILAKEHVPGVRLAMEFNGAINKVMYEMRGYGFTEEPSYYEKGQDKLKVVDVILKKGSTLQAASPHLKEMGNDIQAAVQALDTYKSLVQQTFDLNVKLAVDRTTLYASAAQYMDGSNAYIAGQNEKLISAVNEGQGENSKEILVKISKINTIIDLGNEARVGAFKAQALRSPEIMKQAIMVFSKIPAFRLYLSRSRFSQPQFVWN